MANELYDAIRERRERAVGVRESYYIEQAGPAVWFVQHPTDDKRAYVVDMARETCDCPDYDMRMKELGGECKHLAAIRSLTGQERSGEYTFMPFRDATIETWAVGRRKRVNRFYVTGDISPIGRARFRAIGGVWDRTTKAWSFPDSGKVAAQLLMILTAPKTDKYFDRLLQLHRNAVAAGRIKEAEEPGYIAGWYDRNRDEAGLEKYYGVPIDTLKRLFNG